MKRFLVACLGLANLISLSAQETNPAANVPDPYEWTIRVYRFPADELRTGFVTRESGQLRAPSMPPATADADQIRQFLKNSNFVVMQYLLLQGIPLSKGSLTVADVEKDILVVRTLNATQDLVAGLAKAYVERRPKYVSIETHIVEAESAVIRQIVKEASQGADHKAQWERLQALVAQGQARHISTLDYDTRSGQRAVLSRGTQRKFPVGFSLSESGSFEVTTETRNSGTRLEIDPVIGPDGRTVDLNFALEHDFLPPTARWAPAAQRGEQRIESQMTDFHLAKTTTAITLSSGMTNLLGVWSPELAPATGKFMQAAFLKAEVIPLLPLSDDRLEQMMKAHGEAVEPTPPKPKTLPNEGLPPGMILRRFRVPPTFLTVAGGGGAPTAPADPFAAAAPPPNEPRMMRSVTALDVLKMQGIPFPDGSSANFIAVAGELIVRNTPENMEKIEAFLDELSSSSPQMVGIAVDVVQADGALLRRLGAEMSRLADHAGALKALEEAVAQGKASILRTAWLETRSGQRATFEAITDYMQPGAPTLGEGARSATEADKDKKDRAPSSTLTVKHDTEPVGLRFELDPVIGPDGQTIDLNFALNYDTAEPTQRFEPAGGGEKVLRAESPATDFHKIEVTSAMTVVSGATRIMGVWKPGGKAELEGGDVLQAALVRVDLIKTEPDQSKDGRK